jgi:hypothetical protein
MNMSRTIGVFFTLILLTGVGVFAQSGVGSIKGKVRLENREAASGVMVTVRQGEREVASATTDRKGEFLIKSLAPGLYGMTFRKTGLSVGTLEKIEVKAGKVRELPDRLILTVNEASIARLSGSVFTEDGYSIPGVRIELARLSPDGTLKRVEARDTNESGQFVFRVSPERAVYRVTAKADKGDPQTKDVEVDGAMVYRVAFTLKRPAN